jgi:hypothetical protein
MKSSIEYARCFKNRRVVINWIKFINLSLP